MMFHRQPISTLFPYTTLFRSENLMVSRVRSGTAAARRPYLCALLLLLLALPLGAATPKELQAQMLPADLLLPNARSEEHTSELQSHSDLVCRLLLEKKKMT